MYVSMNFGMVEDYARMEAMMLTSSLDYLESLSDEEAIAYEQSLATPETAESGSSSVTVSAGPEDGETEPEEFQFINFTEETDGPAPVVGEVIGPTTPAAIRTMINNRMPTLQARLAGLQLQRTGLASRLDRARRLWNERAIARAEYEHATALMGWINAKIARVQALIAIGNAAPGDVAGLVAAYNAVSINQANARVTALEAEQNRLRELIRRFDPRTNAAEELDNWQASLGEVGDLLATAVQDRANAQATHTAGGIVLVDWMPPPVMRR